MENPLTQDQLSLESPDFFKAEYQGQLIKENVKFNLFKKAQLTKYGNNAKLFYCKHDGVYFYAPSKNNSSFIFESERECPVCTKKICYFCSEVPDQYWKCCQKDHVYKLFFDYSFVYINNERLDNPDVMDYNDLYPLFFIPLYTYANFVAAIIFCLFYGTIYKKEKKDREYYFQENYKGLIGVILYGVTCFPLYIVYFVFTIYIKILILISSLIFKKYPFKYYLGIISFGRAVLSQV